MGIVLVTGASSGIGKATAIQLAAMGYHVVATGRSRRRIDPVVRSIKDQGNSAEALQLDLGSFTSIRTAASEYLATGRPLDALVNNAGVGLARGITSDGFEVHFGVNHLGHFLLTALLEDAMEPGSRVVQVSSSVHERADGIDFDAVKEKTRSLLGVAEYAVSKLANVLFVSELARRRPDWRAYAVHPGLTRTHILPGAVRLLARDLLTPEQGADTVIWCATSAETAGQTGLYYANRQVISPSAAASNDHLGLELWGHSEDWCGLSLPG